MKCSIKLNSIKNAKFQELNIHPSHWNKYYKSLAIAIDEFSTYTENTSGYYTVPLNQIVFKYPEQQVEFNNLLDIFNII